MSLDKRFALIATNGDVLFPYIKRQEATGRTGFALSTAGNKDREGGGDYTDDLAEVIRRVVFGGYSVRARTDGKSNLERDGSVTLGGSAARRFYVAPEFENLVTGSEFERVSALPAQRPARGSSEGTTPAIQRATPPSDPLSEIADLTVDDYVEALRANESKVSLSQRRMLAAHYAAPDRLQSMRQLASAAGFESYASANLEYGKVGHLVADDVGLDSPGNWTQLLAEGSGARATDGEYGWVLREPLAQALEELGWVEPFLTTLDAQGALGELSKEPGFEGLPETAKQALVNARIGQGGFRRRMLLLWDERCAVTGCAIGEVLVASHAKAWSRSSNEERLDEFNGLPLVATLDRLFDRGLIGFADDGSIVKNERVDWRVLSDLGVTPSVRLRTVQPRHLPYLRHHRAEHGLQGLPRLNPTPIQQELKTPRER